MEQQSFVLLTSTDVMWAIRESSIVRIWVRREGKLDREVKGVHRVVPKVEDEVLEARQGTSAVKPGCSEDIT